MSDTHSSETTPSKPADRRLTKGKRNLYLSVARPKPTARAIEIEEANRLKRGATQRVDPQG